MVAAIVLASKGWIFSVARFDTAVTLVSLVARSSVVVKTIIEFKMGGETASGHAITVRYQALYDIRLDRTVSMKLRTPSIFICHI